MRTTDNSPLGVALSSGFADALRHRRPVVRAVRRDAHAREAQRLELFCIEVKLMERERELELNSIVFPQLQFWRMEQWMEQ